MSIMGVSLFYGYRYEAEHSFCELHYERGVLVDCNVVETAGTGFDKIIVTYGKKPKVAGNIPDTKKSTGLFWGV